MTFVQNKREEREKKINMILVEYFFVHHYIKLNIFLSIIFIGLVSSNGKSKMHLKMLVFKQCGMCVKHQSYFAK